MPLASLRSVATSLGIGLWLVAGCFYDWEHDGGGAGGSAGQAGHAAGAGGTTSTGSEGGEKSTEGGGGSTGGTGPCTRCVTWAMACFQGNCLVEPAYCAGSAYAANQLTGCLCLQCSACEATCMHAEPPTGDCMSCMSAAALNSGGGGGADGTCFDQMQACMDA